MVLGEIEENGFTLKSSLHSRISHVFHGITGILAEVLKHLDIRRIGHVVLGSGVGAQSLENLGWILTKWIGTTASKGLRTAWPGQLRGTARNFV